MVSYAVNKTLAASEAYVSPSTGTLTGYTINLVITTTTTTTVLPQYSTNSGTTWTNHAGGVYSVDNTTDSRTITITGILRLVITNGSSSLTNTLQVRITATSAAEVGVIQVQDVYDTVGLSSTEISNARVLAAILRAESEVRQMIGRPVGSEQITEYYFGNNKKSMFVDNTPVVSLDALTIGTTSITTTYVDVCLDTGQIILKSDAETTKFTLPSNESPQQSYRNITVQYTWGYFSVPYWLKRLAECMAGIIIITEYMGGQFNGVNSYSIGDVSVSLGEPVSEIQATAQMLRKEVDDIIMRNVQKSVAVF